MNLQIQNHHFILHPSGALFWKEADALLISDVHLGKISHFRKHGLAVPQVALASNFEKLEATADALQASQIIFLGDLFHSSLNREWTYFSEWIFGRNEKMILVSGNHDILAAEKYAEAGIDVTAEIASEGFLLTHEPEERPGYFNLCGHIHPGVRLRGMGRQSMDLACFYLTENAMILPAFGEFTGKYLLKPTDKSRIFALAGNAVQEIRIVEQKGRNRLF